MESDPMHEYGRRLEEFRSEGRLRVIPHHHADAGFVDMVSNDYLGLAARQKEFMDDFIVRYGSLPMSASASRLLAQHQNAFNTLERRLEQLYGRPALLFNSGWHANTGIIGALAVPGTLFLADKMVHASMIDGLTQRGCEFERWRHNDVASLRKLIEWKGEGYDRIVVMAESIYSMDGDLAPLTELVALKKEYPNIILYIDEAHGFGVRGDRGLGLCEEMGVTDDVDIIMCTLGKAGASAGAFAVTSPMMKSYLINASRSLIFSTSLPPMQAAWSLTMLEAILEMRDERERLSMLSRHFRELLADATGIEIPGESQIVPLIVGDTERCFRICHALEDVGIAALPIRHPTVPRGTERIRFSLNAALTEDNLEQAAEVVKTVFKEDKAFTKR